MLGPVGTLIYGGLTNEYRNRVAVAGLIVMSNGRVDDSERGGPSC